MVFVDTPAGTGKIYLMNLTLSTVRSHGHIALATASSGIAATLLTGGCTFNSTFKIPLNVTTVETPMCAIKRRTALAKLINDCHAIIVDEVPMTHRLAFEAMDCTLRDISCKDCPMGGILTFYVETLDKSFLSFHVALTAEVLPVAVHHSHVPPHKHENSPSE